MAFKDASVGCDNYQRYLSPLESLYSQMEQQLGIYVQTTILEAERKVSEDIVRKALHTLSTHHYFLQARITRDVEDNPKYSPIENMDKEGNWIQLESINASTVADWKEIVAEDLKTLLDCESGPLWRAKWVTCPTEGNKFVYVLIIVANHIIIDGKVGVDLSTNQFLTLLTAYLEGDKEPAIPKPIYFTHPNDALILNLPNSDEVPMKDYPVPWYIRAGVNTALWLGMKFAKTSAEKSEDDSINRNAFYTFEIDCDTSMKLRSLTKRNEVTIHSVLLVLLSNALKNAEKEGLLKKSSLSTIYYPIDLRKFNVELSTLPMPMGCYTSSGSHSVKYHSTTNHRSIFKHISAVNKSVQSNNKETAAPFITNALVHISKCGKFKDIINICADAAITLSNAGDFDRMVKHNMESESALKVRAQYYTISHGSFFVTTSTVNKQMFFCISYDPVLFTENLIAFVANDLKNAVNLLISLDNENEKSLLKVA